MSWETRFKMVRKENPSAEFMRHMQDTGFYVVTVFLAAPGKEVWIFQKETKENVR